MLTATPPAPLPASIEKQLSDMETRHKRHLVKMDEQHEAKHEARKRHREGWHRRRLAPIHLCHP